MYTIMETISVILLILTVIGAFIWYVLNGINYSDEKSNLQYRTLYNHEDTLIKVKVARNRLTSKRIPLLILASIVLCFVFGTIGGRNLSRERCEDSNGTWKSWDNGMQYECFNPNQIKTNNNFRVITD